MPPLFPLSQQKQKTGTAKLLSKGCGKRPVSLFFPLNATSHIFRSQLKQLENSSRVAATELECKRRAATQLQQLHQQRVEAEITARELKNKALADEAAMLEEQVTT